MAHLPEEVGKPAFQAGEAIRFLDTFRDRPFLSVNFFEPHEAPGEHEVVVEWNGLCGYPQPDAKPDLLEEPEEIKQRLRAADVRSIRRSRWKLNVHASGEYELYDLHADPGELHNAFYDHGADGVAAELFERLLRWQRDTHDTLQLPAAGRPTRV